VTGVVNVSVELDPGEQPQGGKSVECTQHYPCSTGLLPHVATAPIVPGASAALATCENCGSECAPASTDATITLQNSTPAVTSARMIVARRALKRDRKPPSPRCRSPRYWKATDPSLISDDAAARAALLVAWLRERFCAVAIHIRTELHAREIPAIGQLQTCRRET
jgi:hypothetical protein